MSKKSAPSKKEELLQKATELFRTQGFHATSVDDVCAATGVTKGTFFHYFKSKEALAQACLEEWKCMVAQMEQHAPFMKERDPLKKVLRYLDFFLSAVSHPDQIQSCLAGTVVQEVWDTHPNLKNAANACFTASGDHFAKLLKDAAKHYGKTVDAKALSDLYLATFQGSLILYKGSGDIRVFRRNFGLLKSFIRSLFAEAPSRRKSPRRT